MDYSLARGSKLKLKGAKNNVAIKKKKRKVDDGNSKEKQKAAVFQKDRWFVVGSFDEISGLVAIEFGEKCFVKCLDDGTFTLGGPHDDGDGPAPEEIFTAIRINDEKIAMKSGYGKYLGVDKNGNVVGRSDAVGAVEQWEVVFEDGKMALLCHSGHFMSVDPQEETVVCKSRKAGPAEVLKLRCQSDRQDGKQHDGPSEELGSLKDVELNYVKKFQKFEDKRIRLCPEDLKSVKKAKEEGKLHESLLDRRAKMKADRYCK